MMHRHTQTNGFDSITLTAYLCLYVKQFSQETAELQTDRHSDIHTQTDTHTHTQTDTHTHRTDSITSAADAGGKKQGLDF